MRLLGCYPREYDVAGAVLGTPGACFGCFCTPSLGKERLRDVRDVWVGQATRRLCWAIPQPTLGENPYPSLFWAQQALSE